MRRLFLILIIFAPVLALAQSQGTIEISPAKFELPLTAGGSAVRSISLTNHTTNIISVETKLEDFVGGPSAEEPIQFASSSSSSPYSLKDQIKIGPADQKFNLPAGASRNVSFTITLASTTPSGGRYASLIFAIQPKATSSVNVTTEIAALIFVRVLGAAHEQGQLKEFGVQFPKFDILYENQGDIYLNPYGYVSIKNLFNQEVAFIPVDPYFVMPHSLRLQTLVAKQALWPGWYRAELKLNRGYQNMIDTKTQSFFIWSSAGTFLLILLLIILWWLWHKWQ